MERLNAQLVQQQLTPEAQYYFSTIEVFSTLDSTNTYLLTGTHKTGAVCLAEHQSHGRGRQGKTWVSPHARNIYLSTLCAMPNTAYVSGLSLVVGLAVVQALNTLGIPDLRIKWPNDIVHEHHKLAGILLEVAQHSAEALQIVIGIGINVDMPEEANIDQAWIDIKKLHPNPPSRNVIIGQVLNSLHTQLQLFHTQQLKAVLNAWPTVDALYNQPIQFQQNQQPQTGIAKGIDAHGRLRIEQNTTLVAINSGEIKQLRIFTPPLAGEVGPQSTTGEV